jgi:chromosome segregation ATPase
VADEMTPGEIRRSLDRIEGAQRDAHKAIDDRLAEVAHKSVPLELWAAEHKSLGDDVKHLESDFRDAVDRIERTSQERMQTLRTEIGVIRKAQAAHEAMHRDSNQWSRSKTLTLIGIVVAAAATLVGAYIAAFAAAGGVR